MLANTVCFTFILSLNNSKHEVDIPKSIYVKTLCERLEPRFRLNDRAVTLTHHTLEQDQWLRKSFARASTSYFRSLLPISRFQIECYLTFISNARLSKDDSDTSSKEIIANVEKFIKILRRCETPLGAFLWVRYFTGNARL